MFIKYGFSTQESGDAASSMNYLELRSNRYCVQANQKVSQINYQWLDLAMDERSSEYEKGLE